MPVPTQTPTTVERAWPVYPPLLAVFPVLSVFAANEGTLPLAEVWRPVFVAFGVSIALWALLAALLRNARRSAAAMAVIVPSAFLYSWWNGLVPLGDAAVWIYGFIVAGFAVLAAWKLRATAALNLLGVLLFAFVVVRIASGYVRPVVLANIRPTQRVASSPAGRPPDIYYIILDGYGREDELKRNMGFDNSAFVTQLEKRGFYVASQAHSNYCQTEISLASSLNYDLIQNLAPEEKAASEDRRPLDSLVNDNRLSRELKALGYQTVAITSGFPSFTFSHADVRLPEQSRYSLLESTLLQMTPFAASAQGVDSMFVQRRSTLLGAFKNLHAMAGRAAQPRFVFAHVLAPHPPFVFGPNGERKPHKGPYGFWDGSDFMTYVGKPADYRNGYVDQLQWLNKQVLSAVDDILAAPGPRPLILLQGDHGSKLKLDQNSLTKTDVTECFQNLMAYKAPEPVRRRLYPSVTPVNSFRIILSELFGEDLPLLPDRSWYSPFAHPFEFTDVTDRVTAAHR